VISPQFDEAGFFCEEAAIVSIGGKVGVIDLTGKLVAIPSSKGPTLTTLPLLFSSLSKRETPRLCRGGSKGLTAPAVRGAQIYRDAGGRMRGGRKHVPMFAVEFCEPSEPGGTG
jgi:hypothetical protein